jgi:hypothetical protein
VTIHNLREKLSIKGNVRNGLNDDRSLFSFIGKAAAQLRGHSGGLLDSVLTVEQLKGVVIA